MRQLIKYFSKKEYAEMFRSGKLYMNSLSYFWENGFEEQKDCFEGISNSFDIGKMNLPIDFKKIYNDKEGVFRLDAYRYCNLYCFYRVDIDDILLWNPNTKSAFPDTRRIKIPDESMELFGEYVGIVKDEKKFISRVINSINAESMCIMGDVRYRRCFPYNLVTGIKELRPASHWENLGASLTSIKDCFCKIDTYKKQNEWRICLFRNLKIDDKVILDVGDLSDIVDIVGVKILKKYFEEKFNPYVCGEVLPQFDAFRGNVTRKEFQEKIYNFDGGMGKLMFLL